MATTGGRRTGRFGHPLHLLHNKRGEAYVEAALVLPLLFLIILSMIGLVLYEFEGLRAQTGVHEKLIQEEYDNVLPLSVARKENTVSRRPGGIVTFSMSREVRGRCYCIREAEAIRLQEVIGDGTASEITE